MQKIGLLSISKGLQVNTEKANLMEKRKSAHGNKYGTITSWRFGVEKFSHSSFCTGAVKIATGVS